VVAEVMQPVLTPGTAEVLLSPTPAVQTPAGRPDGGSDLQWTEGSNSARESAAAPATAAVLAAVGLLRDAASSVLEIAPTIAPAQAAAGDETGMVEGSELTSTTAVQLRCSFSAAICGLDTDVTAEAARAPAVEEGCGGARSQPPAADRAALQAAGAAAATAVCAPLAADDVMKNVTERVPTAGADDPDSVVDAGEAAAAAPVRGPFFEVDDEPGADVLYSSAAAMIAAVADGIASKLQVYLWLWHCTHPHETLRRLLKQASIRHEISHHVHCWPSSAE